jgi:hypothetical protein
MVCLGPRLSVARGLEVAQAMAGEPFYPKMPKIWRVRLTGELPDWVSAAVTAYRRLSNIFVTAPRPSAR